MVFCLLMASTACSSSSSGKRQQEVHRNQYGENIQANETGLSSIAAREVIRRQEQMRRADAAAMRANEYSRQGDDEAALRSYRKALKTLPDND